MDRISEIYENNKKIINIVLIFIAILIILAIANFFLSRNNNDKNPTNPSVQTSNVSKIVLFGNSVITLNEGDSYIEPGYYAVSSTGELITSDVQVTSKVDTTKPGTYTIVYKLDSKSVTRKVIVLEKDSPTKENPSGGGSVQSTFTFTLKGNSMVVLSQGSQYVEEGYTAYDTIDGNLNSKVQITGKVNTNLPGTYVLTYTVTNSRGEVKKLTRQVIVNVSPVNATLTLNTLATTNNDVTVKVQITGGNFSYVKNPDNSISKTTSYNYKISKNGRYNFYIYDTNNNYIVKEINVTNIDKDLPSGSCSAKVQNGITSINVYASDATSGIKNYAYYGNNSLLKTINTNNYTHSAKLSSVYVIIYDNASNSRKITCTLESEKEYNLEVHFINVGREDAIFIRDGSKNILIDGGSYSKKSIVTPYLKDLGVTKIDAMIGSHLHYNHIQAQADILENFTVDKIYYPQDLKTCYSTYCDTSDQKYILDAIKKYNKSITIMKVNDNINIGDMNIFCIGPISFQTKSQNKYRQNYNSLNFILTYGKNKFMFTGDHMQSSNILKQFNSSLLDVDVLKYPHHGQESIGKSIIEAMTPKYVVVTSSRDDLSSRNEKTYLKNVGASFYYSYKHDNILMTSDGNNITVTTNVKASNYKR